jgi:SAM-dependent methyltransferase
VSDGVVWLSPAIGGTSGGASGATSGATSGAAPDPDKIAALLGITGRAYALLLGDAAASAHAVSRLLDEVEVIALLEPEGAAAAAGASRTEIGAPRAQAEAAMGEWGVSLVVAEGVPIATGKMSGVALMGAQSDALLEEAARAVRPTGRLLVDPAPAGARERLAKLGLRVLAEEGSTLLAVRG